MKKWCGLLAVLGSCVLVNSLAGQGWVSGEDVTQKGTFKWLPNELGDTPEWAERMYSGDTDFHEIADLRTAYLKGRSYEKTIHERNFKHWLMHVEHRVGPDGIVQNAGEWAAAAFERGGGVEGQVQRAAEVDPEWQAIGPFETWNNGEEGHFPVSWQCNIYCFDQSTSNPDVAIAGVEAGDLFKTTNKGQSWTPVTLGVPGIRTVTQCAVAPSSASNFYFVSNNTVYGSVNGGSTWELLYNLGSSANQLGSTLGTRTGYT